MITQVPGFSLGHASDFKNLTGCTVILCPPGTVGSADIRGSAAGTRQMDALLAYHISTEVHAVFVSGGSAFGLDAAGGVMEYLEERGRGFDVTVTRVPIVPTAVIYDLSVGNCRARPDKAMGYAACQAAKKEPQGDGSVGAGVGATVGKLLGIQQASKGGLGTAFLAGPGGLKVGAVAVVNALGDVVDPETGAILAGVRTAPDSTEFADAAGLLRRGVVRRRFGEPVAGNTTIGVVATNARLTREQAQKIAQMGHNALARTIRPVHTLFDGDVVFMLAHPEVEADLHVIGLLGETALQQAIVSAVTSAQSLGVLPSYRDLREGGPIPVMGPKAGGPHSRE
jgi:L-aminopeptidase/D-esterase-like protein